MALKGDLHDIELVSRLKEYCRDVIIKEMEAFIDMEDNQAEARTYVKQCKVDLQRAWERLSGFVNEIRKVCYDGNITELRSFVIKFSGFWGCTCLSQPYARSMIGAINRAMDLFESFEKTCNKLISECRVEIVELSKNKATSDLKGVYYAAGTCAIVVAACAAAPMALPVYASAIVGSATLPAMASVVGGSAAAVGGSAAAVGGSVVTGSGAVRCRNQAKTIEEVKSMFDDVHETATRLQEIGVVLKEKLVIVKKFCEFLMDESGCGYSVQNRMDGLYCKLNETEQYIDKRYSKVHCSI